MTTVAQLTIEMAANVARLSTDMDAARRKVDSTFGAIGKDVNRLKNLIGGVFAGFGAQQTLGKLISVQREFDVLNSSLVTVTGSSTVAEQQMRWIKEFASTTPYQLSEVTAAFVKMKALGLDASQAALTSYGNTASAMGKSLNQMIEAVADAATGEFERLKEFGIKARKEGDQVSLTFQGVTTNINNNARDITQYLQRLGDVSFAGAMERRAQTLDGAISNLADSWDELFRTVSSNNVGGLIYDSVKLANGVLGDAVTILQAMNAAQSSAASSTGALVSAQSGLATVFETVAVLGANVKYVLVQTGRELGGLAAQAAQILQGNFSAAAAIRSGMVEDSQAARREVDATTARILNARRLAGVAQSGVGMDEPRFARLLRGSSSGAAAGGGGGASTAAASRGAAVAASRAAAEASRAEAEALRRVIDIAAERNRQFDEEFAASERQRMTVEGRIKSGREMLATIELETRMLSMSREERELTTTLLELERQGIVKGTEAYAAYGEAIKKALGEKQAQEALIKKQEAAKALAEEEQKENARRTASLAQSIEDGIMTGFRNGQSFADVFLNELKAQFAKTVLRPLIEPIASAGNALITSLFSSIGFPSFAGGGYTGNGSRSGGMDGQGGYLAMLHPRETVVDHAKGQGAGQSINITINNTIGNVASQADVVGGMQAVRAQIMGELSRSMRYGGAAA